MTVSYDNSKIIFQGIKDASVASLPALPETWLGLLLQQHGSRCQADPQRHGGIDDEGHSVNSVVRQLIDELDAAR